MNPNQLPKITLEQWAALKAVVDEGSHAKAAEALNKSQSTISYLINRLNEQLPSPALTLQGRKATLTDVGALLYRYASNLLSMANACEDAAQFAASGWESQIRLTCDALTPMTHVMCALQHFSEQAPLTRIKILETSLSGTDETLFNHECDLAITPRVPPGFLGTPLTRIAMVACAHVDHPLSNMDRISEDELKTHRQIVVRDSGAKREQDAGWLGAMQRWTVSHFATSMDMVTSGLGFAFLPNHPIQPPIDAGTLDAPPLEIGATREISLHWVSANPVIGPGTSALKEAIEQRFIAAPGSR